MGVLCSVVRKRVGKALAFTLVLSAAFCGRGYAATNWSPIESAMKVNGTPLPGDVLRFEIVRQDLGQITVNGKPVDENEAASGFVSFKEVTGNRFFVVGSLPVLESELSAVQTVLSFDNRIRVSAIASRFVLESPSLTWLHFEATGNGSSIASSVASVLAMIHNPQVGVNVVPGTQNVISNKDIPAPLKSLFKKGTLEQIGTTIAFYLPRPDAVTLGPVAGEAGLGIGQSFYITIQGDVDSTTVTLDADFALRANELKNVVDILTLSGFTISSVSNNNLNDNPHLYYVHASASGNGFGFVAPLLAAVDFIGAN